MGSKMHQMQAEMEGGGSGLTPRSSRDSRSSIGGMLGGSMFGGSRGTSRGRNPSHDRGATSSDIAANISSMQSLNIREGKNGVYVEGQSKVAIKSMSEVC